LFASEVIAGIFAALLKQLFCYLQSLQSSGRTH